MVHKGEEGKGDGRSLKSGLHVSIFGWLVIFLNVKNLCLDNQILFPPERVQAMPLMLYFFIPA